MGVKYMLLRIAITCALILVAGSASAGPLDFADAATWMDGAGQHSFTYETEYGTVRLYASPGSSYLTFTEGEGVGVDCDGCAGSYQIEPPESLAVAFFDGSVFVESVTLSSFGSLEIGKVGDENSIMWFYGEGDDLQTLAIGFEADYIRVLPYFGASFTVASIELSVVPRPMPEPESLVLFPIGALLVGYVLLRRRRELASTS